jgi:hypothetical protein
MSPGEICCDHPDMLITNEGALYEKAKSMQRYKYCIKINSHYRLHPRVYVVFVALELNYNISIVHNNTVPNKIPVILTC